jgi:hypothetical protein
VFAAAKGQGCNATHNTNAPDDWRNGYGMRFLMLNFDWPNLGILLRLREAEKLIAQCHYTDDDKKNTCEFHEDLSG